jgi:cation transport ATPase
VKTGEQILVDGWILEGAAQIDERNLTGETIPVFCAQGQAVYASTLVIDGKICIVAEHTGLNSRIGIVAQLLQSTPVHDTQLGIHQAEVVRSAIVPTILLGGTLFALTGSVGAAVSPFQFDFGSGIPISVHTTLLSALTYAARHGIYIWSARTLELLSQLNAIVFDSSGLVDSTHSVRPESQATIAQLHHQGVETYCIIQDESHAEIAGHLGIPKSHIWVEASQDQATNLISGLQHHGKTVAFMGTNAQATIQANVSISFADQPNQSDVVFMHDDLRALNEAIAIAKRAFQVVYENTAIIVMPNLLIQIVGGMILGVNPVINVITNNSSAFVAEFVHGSRPLFDHRTPSPMTRYPRKLCKAIQETSAPVFETAVQFLKQTELAKRLGVPFQALTPQRSKPEFGHWTQAKDPEGKAWRYDAIAKGFYAIEA